MATGVCYQTWVDQGEFGDMCRKTARYAPNIIFLGEVRDSETASEALRASINGAIGYLYDSR
jgi:type II secretory ATPase GspE/PulE/Tfp pilus assembly ATPase PilB-like protein